MSSNIVFLPVTEINDPLTLSLGISGGSGTGKTYSALLVARGIAEVVTGQKGAKIGYVDTENRRALHYKSAFPEMMHFDMQAVDGEGNMIGFGPERWIEVIEAAEAANLPVLILDSFSHAWEGVGGVLDLHAQTLDRLTGGDESKRNQRSQLAWASVKPRYRRLIDRIVRAKTNIIICTRAKPVMQDIKTKLNARDTKTRRKDVPWDPAADGDLMFEMTTMVILDPAAPGCPVHQIKVADQFKGLLDPRQPMGVETGRKMAEWAQGQGEAQRQKEVLDVARAQARKGTQAYTEWFKANPDHRAIARTITAELKEICSLADAAKAGESSDDPFAAFSDDEKPPSPHEDMKMKILADLEEAPSVEAVRIHHATLLSKIKDKAPDIHAELERVFAAKEAA